MNSFLTILRFILLLLSLFGAAVFLRKRTKIAYAFCMPMACAFLVCILFLFGLFMPITAIIWILFGVGILMLIFVILRREICREDILNRTNLFLLMGAVVLVLILTGRHFIYVDDFTHWATYSRAVIENQGLPDASESLLSFVSYPPASALWVCWFTDIIGSSSEDICLIGQGLFTLILTSSLTYFPEYKRVPQETSRKGRGVRAAIRILTFLFLLGFCAFILTFGGSFFSLYVDGLLTAAGLTGTAFLLFAKQPVYRKAFFSIPFTLLVMLLKDTGFVFVFSVFVILIYQAVKEYKEFPGGKNKNILSILILFFSVVIMEFLWRLHTAIAFPEGGIAGGEADQVPHNSPEQFRHILHGFFYGKKLYGVLAFLIALILFYLVCRAVYKKTQPDRKSAAMRLLLFSLIHFLIFYAGLLCVYLFQMAFVYAQDILEYTRYMSVEFLYLVGVCFCYALREFSVPPGAGSKDAAGESRERRVPVLLILAIAADILISAALFVWFSGHVQFRNYEGSPRQKLHMLNTEDYRGDLLYYAPSLEDTYEGFMLYWYSYYDFRTADAELFRYWLDLEPSVSAHSRLLIYDVDERITQFMHEHGFTGEVTPGIYDVADLNLLPKKEGQEAVPAD